MKFQSLYLATACLSLGCLVPQPAAAHMIQTDFQARMDRFELQSTFGDGEAFPHAPVTVYSPENPDQPLIIGRTDEDGKFSFQADLAHAGDWTVEVGSADDSHWDRLIIPIEANGIDASAISTVPAEEHHHSYFAYSGLVLMLGLGAGLTLKKRHKNS